MAIDTEHYLSLLSRYLGSRRHAHSRNVAQLARELALHFAPELADKAELAGLLHDNAKRMKGDELIRLAVENDIEITPVERETPTLLHGKIGALLLAERFGVSDAEIAQAVTDHVTGRLNMGMLSRILFVADQAAIDREFAGVEELRASSILDLDRAVFIAVKHKLLYSINLERIVDPRGLELYNSLCLKEQQRAPG